VDVESKLKRSDIKLKCLIFNQDPFPFYLKLTKIENPLSNHSKTISNHQILNYINWFLLIWKLITQALKLLKKPIRVILDTNFFTFLET